MHVTSIFYVTNIGATCYRVRKNVFPGVGNAGGFK
jgi:hypothetical protein